MFKELTWVGWAHFLQFYQQYLWHVIFLHFEAKFAEIIIAVLIIYKISFMNISKSSGHLFKLETTAMNEPMHIEQLEISECQVL